MYSWLQPPTVVFLFRFSPVSKKRERELYYRTLRKLAVNMRTWKGDAVQKYSVALGTENGPWKRGVPQGCSQQPTDTNSKGWARRRGKGRCYASPRPWPLWRRTMLACHASEMVLPPACNWHAWGNAVIIWGMNPGIMHFLFRLIVFFYVWGIFTAQGQKAEETTEEVKIEVLHRPENCSKTSKKGDLLNAHYDGFLAKDGSKFYCR